MFFNFYLLLILLNTISVGREKERWLVERSSTITITGESNINEFTCQFTGRQKADTLTIDYDHADGDIRFVKKKVEIDVRSFDCGNPLITKDFKHTLKTDQYPVINLDFISLKRPQFKDFSANSITGSIRLTIAGISNHYIISYTIKPNTDGTIDLSGCTTLNIREFELSPPERLLGLIRVNENIDVNFKMHLTPLL